MAATVQIGEKNGAGATFTDKTSGTIKFKNADDAANDNADPMRADAGVIDYSYEKWIRLKVTGGTYTEITNIRAYSDGSFAWTGVTLSAKAVASYATPSHLSSLSGFTSLASYNSGSPLSLGAGPYTSTGEKGDHLVMGMAVDGDTASAGVLASETLTIAWDEI